MFGQSQTPKSEGPFTVPLITIAVSGGLLLVSLGLCGLGGTLKQAGGAFVALGVAALALGLFGIVASVVMLIVAFFRR